MDSQNTQNTQNIMNLPKEWCCEEYPDFKLGCQEYEGIYYISFFQRNSDGKFNPILCQIYGALSTRYDFNFYKDKLLPNAEVTFNQYGFSQEEFEKLTNESFEKELKTIETLKNIIKKFCFEYKIGQYVDLDDGKKQFVSAVNGANFTSPYKEKESKDKIHIYKSFKVRVDLVKMKDPKDPTKLAAPSLDGIVESPIIFNNKEQKEISRGGLFKLVEGKSLFCGAQGVYTGTIYGDPDARKFALKIKSPTTFGMVEYTRTAPYDMELAQEFIVKGLDSAMKTIKEEGGEEEKPIDMNEFQDFGLAPQNG